MTVSNQQPSPALDVMPEARRTLLLAIKTAGSATASMLANELGITREAARQQLLLLHQQQLVASHKQRGLGAGRPKRVFTLTKAGEHLFPKRYDELSLMLLDTVTETLGDEQVTRVLTSITDRQVAQWQQQLDGMTIREKLEEFKDFYFENDPYTRVVEDEKGLWLIEQNCPFLNLAMERPALCSITVSTLTRLLGVRVKREKRFQNGDGHCAFHILVDQPVPASFTFGYETP